MMEPEGKVAKILVLRSKYKDLKEEKKTLIHTFHQSEQVASDLRNKATEASRMQELTIAHLSTESLSNNTSKYSNEQRPGNESFEYAERKLGIKHNIVVISGFDHTNSYSLYMISYVYIL